MTLPITWQSIRNMEPWADFDRLVAEAKKSDIRIIMDYVSTTRPKESLVHRVALLAQQSQARLVYLARWQGCPGQPPNNWLSWFGHSAWQFDPTTERQYYYHYFYHEQPDLNWRNPQVREAMYGVMRFWLDRGVSGFRIDAVSRLFEDPALHDDPLLPGTNAYGDPNIQHKYTDNLPEVQKYSARCDTSPINIPATPF